MLVSFLVLWPGTALAPETGQKPIPTDFQERSRVQIRQLEVTAWPARDDPTACRALRPGDFLLLVNGQPRRILAVDPAGQVRTGAQARAGEGGAGPGQQPGAAGNLAPQGGRRTDPPAKIRDQARFPGLAPGHHEAGQTDSRSGNSSPSAVLPATEASGKESPPATATDPLQLVFYFDLWHLNHFVKQCGALSQPLAFLWVRQMLEESFQPEDTMLLASFAGRPRMETGWLRDALAARQALDQLEASPAMKLPYRGHYRHDQWEKGWMDLFQALGRTAGRKDLFYLGDDLDWDPPPGKLYGMVGRAQANRVVVHAVDLIWNCRLRRPLFNSRYTMPLSLGTLPFHTGGRLFGGSVSVARAVAHLHQLQPCRFRLSFQTEEHDARHRPPRIKVSLKPHGFRLAGPVSYQTLKEAPTRREKERARKLRTP